MNIQVQPVDAYFYLGKLVEPPPAGAGEFLKLRDLPQVATLSSPGWSRGIPSRWIKYLQADSLFHKMSFEY